MSNLGRRLQLQRLLGTPGRTWSTRDLAARLGVSKLTVARDLDALSLAGVPVVSGKEGQTLRWRLVAGVGTTAKQPDASPGGLVPHVRFPRARRAVKPHVLRVLEEGLLRHRLVQLTYVPRSAAASCELSLAPVSLDDVGGVLYLRGLLAGSGERRRRTLVGWRIRSARLLGESFVPPARPRRRAFGAVDEPTEAVTVRFDKVIAPYVEERRWHPSERLVRHGDGSLIWRARVSGMHEVVGWVMSWGARAELVRPVAWREEVRRRLQRMSGVYAPLHS